MGEERKVLIAGDAEISDLRRENDGFMVNALIADLKGKEVLLQCFFRWSKDEEVVERVVNQRVAEEWLEAVPRTSNFRLETLTWSEMIQRGLCESMEVFDLQTGKSFEM